MGKLEDLLRSVGGEVVRGQARYRKDNGEFIVLSHGDELTDEGKELMSELETAALKPVVKRQTKNSRDLGVLSDDQLG